MCNSKKLEKELRFKHPKDKKYKVINETSAYYEIQIPNSKRFISQIIMKDVDNIAGINYR